MIMINYQIIKLLIIDIFFLIFLIFRYLFLPLS